MTQPLAVMTLALAGGFLLLGAFGHAWGAYVAFFILAAFGLADLIVRAVGHDAPQVGWITQPRRSVDDDVDVLRGTH